MNHTVYYTAPSGNVLYAFPVSQSLANWATYRVSLAENSAPNTGRYSGVLNDANGIDWRVFQGSAQPNAWDEYIASIDLSLYSAKSTIDTNLDSKVSDAGLNVLSPEELANFQAFLASNTNAASIDDLTTPKDLTITVP